MLQTLREILVFSNMKVISSRDGRARYSDVRATQENRRYLGAYLGNEAGV